MLHTDWSSMTLIYLFNLSYFSISLAFTNNFSRMFLITLILSFTIKASSLVNFLSAVKSLRYVVFENELWSWLEETHGIHLNSSNASLKFLAKLSLSTYPTNNWLFLPKISTLILLNPCTFCCNSFNCWGVRCSLCLSQVCFCSSSCVLKTLSSHPLNLHKWWLIS